MLYGVTNVSQKHRPLFISGNRQGHALSGLNSASFLFYMEAQSQFLIMNVLKHVQLFVVPVCSLAAEVSHLPLLPGQLGNGALSSCFLKDRTVPKDNLQIGGIKKN